MDSIEKYIAEKPVVPAREAWQDKAAREASLVSNAVTAIPGAAKEAFTERPVETGLKLLGATGISLALGYATHKAGPLRSIAQSIGVGLGVAAIGDFGRNLSPVCSAFADSWRSSANHEANVALMRRHFAPLVVDTGLTVGVGLAGGFSGKYMARSHAIVPTLPEFTAQGFMPPGIHRTSWSEFATRFGTTPRRRDLLVNIEHLLQEARLHRGTQEPVFVGGSFVSKKELPSDFDMTWRISGPEIAALENKSTLLTNRQIQKDVLGGQLMATYPNSPADGVLGFLQRRRQPNSSGLMDVGVVEIDLSTLPSRTLYKARTWLGRTQPRAIEPLKYK